MKIDELERIITFLERVHPDNFDLSILVGTGSILEKVKTQPEVSCGSVGCIVGHFPNIFPEEYEWNGKAIRNLNEMRTYDGGQAAVLLASKIDIPVDMSSWIVFDEWAYYGDADRSADSEDGEDNQSVTLKAVINRLKEVRDGIATPENYSTVWAPEED